MCILVSIEVSLVPSKGLHTLVVLRRRARPLKIEGGKGGNGQAKKGRENKWTVGDVPPYGHQYTANLPAVSWLSLAARS